MKSINVQDYSKIHQTPKAHLIDVRTIEEFQFCNIGGLNIPLDQLMDHLSEMPQDKDIYFLCHHGVRSQHACSILSAHGHTNTYNIMGGTEAWSTQVDPNLPRY